jgi:hypothetical protein
MPAELAPAVHGQSPARRSTSPPGGVAPVICDRSPQQLRLPGFAGGRHPHQSSSRLRPKLRLVTGVSTRRGASLRRRLIHHRKTAVPRCSRTRAARDAKRRRCRWHGRRLASLAGELHLGAALIAAEDRVIEIGCEQHRRDLLDGHRPSALRTSWILLPAGPTGTTRRNRFLRRHRASTKSATAHRCGRRSIRRAVM